MLQGETSKTHRHLYLKFIEGVLLQMIFLAIFVLISDKLPCSRVLHIAGLMWVHFPRFFTRLFWYPC
jgi:hypothetical protein